MSSARRVSGLVTGLLFKGLAAAFAILAPLLGVWGASSLAAYLNGPVWAVVLSGVALFPLGPLLWDLISEHRRKRKRPEAKRYLTFFDRMILRTLALNLVFIVGLLALAPSKAFEALSTRGDWILDGRTDDTSAAIREGIFWAAEKLEWLYRVSRNTPFDEMADDTVARRDDDVTPEPAPELPVKGADAAKDGDGGADTKPSGTDETTGDDEDEHERATDEPAPRNASWPLPSELHPAVASLPKGQETSIASVATYLKQQEPEPLWLLKALHDYVADRVAYDGPAYRAGRYPPQDAETVFRERTGVCAGYANLLRALGDEAGLRVAFVAGDARTRGWDFAGGGHAWNAAEIDGKWYLLDTTWDAGTLDGTRFEKKYRTDYLFAPPRIFGMDHFPDDPRWQLRDEPLSRGEFLRQPMLKPRFFANGLELIAPERSQITVSGSVGIEMDNPRGLYALARYAPTGGGQGDRCQVESGERVRIDCRIPQEGRYDVSLFVNPERYGSFTYVGRVGVNNAL